MSKNVVKPINNSYIKKAVAEFIGTFVLVFFGCGTACVVGTALYQFDVESEGMMRVRTYLLSSNVGYLITALAFGLCIVAMAYSIGNVSGCHINPAVTLAMLITKQITLIESAVYVVAQFLGGIFGGYILYVLFGKESGLGTNSLKVAVDANGEAVFSKTACFFAEVIMTFVFVLVILGVTSKVKNSNVAGLVIGFSLTLVHLFGIGVTGTSVNPARSFGPAIFAGGDALKDVWVFIVAPLVGSAIAAFVWLLLADDKDKK